jgi:hypothetical protein
MHLTFRALIASSLVVSSSSFALAALVQPGDIVAPQFDNFGTVIVIHPNTHTREILSLAPNIGMGPAMSRPESIVRLADGSFLVADTFAHEALTRINSLTGDRTDLASASIGSGAWGTPYTVLLTPPGDVVLVCDGFVARVNLSNGNRTLISGNGVGSGPNFAFNGAGGVALDLLGHVVVGVYDQPEVYDIDLVTGARTILSGLGIGSGPALSNILDLAVLPTGQIIAEGRNLAAGMNENELFRIDPVTGNRTLISSGSYPNFEYERLAVGTDGNLLGSVPSLEAVFSVDPTTGARTLISGDGLGSGPQLFWGDMVQITVPEPSVGLLAAGATLWFVLRHLRGFMRRCTSI